MAGVVPYKLRSNNPKTQFRFTSEGPKGNIEKMIEFSPFGEGNLYNLAMGDVDEIEMLNDTVISNNGDMDRILVTTAKAIYNFTNDLPEALIYIAGSSAARTRLYQIKISIYLQEISPNFEVYGYVDGGWEHFSRNHRYEAFLLRRKQNTFE